ncbi:putative tetraspanin-19 [Dissostichus eleginoides]|uniref:Tetraspanin-19 n=1 Tax=Dissostichus eleginoides TaxID=100907 RepID=A0AAD9C5K9_DISEL|nr:putative tetraspanin-19 [Dissostichus eleginoides]
MKLNVKIQILNFFFQVLNFLFLALGLSVLGLGVWILFGGTLLTVQPSVGLSLLLVGGLVLLVSVLGFLGSEREIRVLLMMFGADRGEDRLMDRIQHSEKCCGRMGPADWLKNSYIITLNLTNPDVLPCSCFDFHRQGNSSWCSNLSQLTPPHSWGNGSYEQENALTIIGMDLGLMLIQMMQMALTVQLYQAFGRRAGLKRVSPLEEEEEEEEEPGQQNYAFTLSDNEYLDPAHNAHHHDYHEPADLGYYHDNQDYHN